MLSVLLPKHAEILLHCTHSETPSYENSIPSSRRLPLQGAAPSPRLITEWRVPTPSAHGQPKYGRSLHRLRSTYLLRCFSCFLRVSIVASRQSDPPSCSSLSLVSSSTNSSSTMITVLSFLRDSSSPPQISFGQVVDNVRC